MKTCATCGRIMVPRKKWAKNWDQVKYCSDRCRKRKPQDSYEAQILELLKRRGAEKTICPSEVLPESQKQDKVLMERVRSAARRLAAQGKIAILQKGVTVDPSKAKGPIRIKLLGPGKV